MRRPRVAAVLAGVVLLAGFAGCTVPDEEPRPGPTTTSTTVPPITVVSTDPIRVTDPAAITDAASSTLSLNVFQRLMTADPGQPVLKPDAARDCLFTSDTAYTCTLNANTVFHNGDELDSSDVKFSIQRAARLAVPGSSAGMLSSLRRIETPDPLTVRFVLSRVDTQFGWALASPAASIVDEELYNADEVRRPDEAIVGSGPFAVARFADGVLDLRRNQTYVGRNPARSDAMVYRTLPDSASVEDALAKGTAEVAWRGPNAAAMTRYTRQVEQSEEDLTDDGYRMQVLTGTRVRQLQWSPTSRRRDDAEVRKAIAVALQGDRTLDSLVPDGVPGHVSAFPLGGKAQPEVTWSSRIQLTLAYDPTMPDGQDVATQIRTRLEDTGGLSVRLRPGAEDADLTILDRKAWTATGLAWLQPYLDAPASGSQRAVDTLQVRYRSSTEEDDAQRLLAALQRQSAVDVVMAPLTQSDEYLLARADVEVPANSFGPGWQLGFWGMRRA